MTPIRPAFRGWRGIRLSCVAETTFATSCRDQQAGWFGIKHSRLAQGTVTIEKDLKETKDGVLGLLRSLQEHTIVEGQDRVKLLAWIIATLLSVIGFGFAAIWQLVLK